MGLSEDTFQQLVDKYKNMKDRHNNSCLYQLLLEKDLSKKLMTEKKLNQNNISYLLKNVESGLEVYQLFNNAPVVVSLLSDVLFNNSGTVRDFIDRVNCMIKDNSWCVERNVHNVFEYIEHQQQNDSELLELNEICGLLYNFKIGKDSRIELTNLLKRNKRAKNIIKQIVDNNLQAQYDFDQLKKLLIKDERKKKIKLNF